MEELNKLKQLKMTLVRERENLPESSIEYKKIYNRIGAIDRRIKKLKDVLGLLDEEKKQKVLEIKKMIEEREQLKVSNTDFNDEIQKIEREEHQLYLEQIKILEQQYKNSLEARLSRMPLRMVKKKEIDDKIIALEKKIAKMCPHERYDGDMTVYGWRCIHCNNRMDLKIG